MKEMALRGRIITMFKTLDRFAEEIGWSHRKVSYIVNGRQEPTARDIEEMCDVLKVELPDDFRVLFLS